MKLILGIILNVAVAKFTPTSEWQVWGEDEPLPEGLHYRINLETGLKEAKLLENENAKTGGSAVQVAPDNPETPDANEGEELVNAKRLKLTDEQKASMKKINDYLDSLKSERESAELDVEVTHDFDVMKNLTQIISESNNFVVVDSGR